MPGSFPGVIKLSDLVMSSSFMSAGRKAELQEALIKAREEQGPLAQLQQQPKQQTWSDLTSDQIRTQLQLRDLPTVGLKPALIDRITQAAGPEVALLDPSDSAAIAAAKAAGLQDQPASSESASVAADQEQDGMGTQLPAAASATDSQPDAEQVSADATDLSAYK